MGENPKLGNTETMEVSDADKQTVLELSRLVRALEDKFGLSDVSSVEKSDPETDEALWMDDPLRQIRANNEKLGALVVEVKQMARARGLAG